MTQVRIPALATGRASVRLVTAIGYTQVVGFEGDEWATIYTGLDLSADQTITLTPTDAILTAGGGQTCYLITVTASGARSVQYRVQVPDSQTVQELADLVAATSDYPAASFEGFLRIAVVTALPDPQVTGTLYLVKA